MLVLLADDRLNPLVQLLRHDVQGLGEQLDFRGARGPQAMIEFAPCEAFRAGPHRFERADDSPCHNQAGKCYKHGSHQPRAGNPPIDRVQRLRHGLDGKGSPDHGRDGTVSLERESQRTSTLPRAWR